MRVALSAAARLDLLALYDLVGDDDIEAIDRLVEELDVAMRHLGDWPELGRSRPELRPGVRSLASATTSSSTGLELIE